MRTVVKYPANREVKKKLKHGDTKVLANRTGYKKSTIGVILNGHRRMPDMIATEIIKLIEERSALAQKMNQLVQEKPQS
ncbi:MAG: hypothetical protein KGZ82_10785 [Bacteroidales bacterium]|nr:hypothetical protein [Bacteroidales bacterium]